MGDWRLQGNLMLVQGVRLRLHRIGLSHWQAGTRLRSWGVAPLHREGELLLAPCAPDEALWIGAWLDDDGQQAGLRLRDAAAGLQATAELPREFQLTCLDGRLPLTVTAGAAARPLALSVTHAGRQCGVALQLLAPDDWAARAGRPALAALAGPPAPPPRYG